jgi:hypothetical protein
MVMKKVALMVVAFSISIVAMAQDAAAIMKKVKAKLDKVSDYEAKGTLKTEVKFLKVPEANITIYFVKPDKFKIKQDKGISLLPKGTTNINMGSLLKETDVAFVLAGTTTIAGVSCKKIKMVPLVEEGDVATATFYVDDVNSLIKKAEITTKESGSFTIEMTHGKYKDFGLPDKAVIEFNVKKYKLPKGVTVEYDGEKKKEAANEADKKGKLIITYTSYEVNKGKGSAGINKK